MLRRFILLFILITACCAVAAEEDLPNLKEPRPNVFTAGQPTEKGLQEMVERGVHTVVNLRPHDEPNARDESAELQKQGASYVNIPITPDTITLEKVKEFSCVLRKNPDTPVLLHCASANRVGGMWLLHRVLIEKADAATATQEARDIGMNSKLEPVVLGLLEQYRTEDLALNCP